MKENENDFRNATDKAADTKGTFYGFLKELAENLTGEKIEEFTGSDTPKAQTEENSIEEFFKELGYDDNELIGIAYDMQDTFHEIEIMGRLSFAKVDDALSMYKDLIDTKTEKMSEGVEEEMLEAMRLEFKKLREQRRTYETIMTKIEQAKTESPEQTEVDLGQLFSEEEREGTQEVLKEAFGAYYRDKMDKTIQRRNLRRMEVHGGTAGKIPFKGSSERESITDQIRGMGEVKSFIADDMQESLDASASGPKEKQTPEARQSKQTTASIMGVPSQEIMQEIEKGDGKGINIDPLKEEVESKPESAATLEEHEERDVTTEETAAEVEAEDLGSTMQNITDDYLLGIEPDEKSVEEEEKPDNLEELNTGEKPEIETETTTTTTGTTTIELEERTERDVTAEETKEEVEVMEQEDESKSVEDPTQEILEEKEREDREKETSDEQEDHTAQDETMEMDDSPSLLQSIAKTFRGLYNRFFQKKLDAGKNVETSKEVVETEIKGEDSSTLDNKWQLRGQELVNFRDGESQVLSVQQKNAEDSEKTEKGEIEKNNDEMQI